MAVISAVDFLAAGEDSQAVAVVSLAAEGHSAAVELLVVGKFAGMVMEKRWQN
jgi:hypothetical protein